MVIANVRLKLQKDLASAMPCIRSEDRQGKPLAYNTLTGQTVAENLSVHAAKTQRTQKIALHGKDMWESFRYGLGHESISIHAVVKVTRSPSRG